MTNQLDEILVSLVTESARNGRIIAANEEQEDAGIFTAQKTITNADSPYPANEFDGQLFADTTGGVVTINLPSAIGIGGREYPITDKGNAAVNNVTIGTTGAETINGAATYTINTNYGSAIMKSDGANWYVIATA